MIAGGGKRKGNAYEREICKRLSLWISDGQRQDLLWRSASSGAVQTIHEKKGRKDYSSQAGDIVAIDPLGDKLTNRFYVECKHYSDLGFPALVMGRNCKFEKFWSTTVTKSKAIKKIPMMVSRQNRGLDLIALPGWFSSQFLTLDSVVVKRLNLVIFNLEDFCKELPFDHFINMLGNYPK